MIDHIFTNSGDFCTKAISVPVGCSDHNLIAMVRKTRVPKAGHKIIVKRSYKSFTEDGFTEDVRNICWDDVLISKNLDAAVEVFNKLFLEVSDKHAPIKKRTVRKVRAGWIDTELRDCMVQRDEAKRVANVSNYETDWQIYRKLRNYVTKLNKKKKKVYYDSLIINEKHDNKKLWSILKSMLGRNVKSTPSFLESGGQFITKPMDIANHLNNYFCDKIDRLRDDMGETNNSKAEFLIRNCIMVGKTCNFEFVHVTAGQVEKLLLECKEKPSGVDNIDPKLLKLAASFIAVPIAHILNLSFNKGVYPHAWKSAKIVPLPKNTAVPFCGPNSRPVSLLPALSKIMERIVFEQIQKYFSDNNLNTDFQHAYRAGHSTATAMAQMTNDWLMALDNRRLAGAVLLDFSSAFDLIDHNLLLRKMQCYGFGQAASLWLQSYLENRRQAVFFNGSFSDGKNVRCGIPQGSCLGPLLFSIYTNDLPLVLKKAKIAMYADDSTIYSSQATIEELQNVLMEELKAVLEWVTNNKLVLNVGKTKGIVFGTKHMLLTDPKLHLVVKDISVEQVRVTKLLGVEIDNKLSWSEHIRTVVRRMGQSLSMVRRCSHMLPLNMTADVIKTLVLWQLDYCSEIWSCAAVTHIKTLQTVQNRAARCALRCPLRTNVNWMHNILSWLKVKERFTASLLNFTRNIVTTKLPNVLFQKLCLSSDEQQ